MTSKRESLKKNILELTSNKNESGIGSNTLMMERLTEIGLESIYIDKNIRTNYDQDGIDDLAESIKNTGLQQPIVVKDEGNRYKLIFGHRRYLACKKIGLLKIKAIIKNIDDNEILLAQLVENLQREDLTAIEEAEGIQKLMEERNLSQQEVSSLLGKSKSRISGNLSILKLLEKVPRAELLNIPKRTLEDLSRIIDEPYFYDIYNKIKDGSTSVDLRNLIQFEKFNKDELNKKSEIRKKDIHSNVNDIFSTIKQLNDKVMKLKIKFGDNISMEIEDDIKTKLTSQVNSFLQLISALFKGEATISANITVSKPKDDSSEIKLNFPNTSTKIVIVKSLLDINYSFIDYSTTKNELIKIIQEKLPLIQESVLKDANKETLIDQWNALPFNKPSKKIDGFFYKAITSNYKLPSEYLKIKSLSLEKSKNNKYVESEIEKLENEISKKEEYIKRYEEKPIEMHDTLSNNRYNSYKQNVSEDIDRLKELKAQL